MIYDAGDLGPIPTQQRVDQLPDHLLAYHHWTAEQLKDWQDKLRWAHLLDHNTRDFEDHRATDWSC